MGKADRAVDTLLPDHNSGDGVMVINQHQHNNNNDNSNNNNDNNDNAVTSPSNEAVVLMCTSTRTGPSLSLTRDTRPLPLSHTHVQVPLNTSFHTHTTLNSTFNSHAPSEPAFSRPGSRFSSSSASSRTHSPNTTTSPFTAKRKYAYAHSQHSYSQSRSQSQSRNQVDQSLSVVSAQTHTHTDCSPSDDDGNDSDDSDDSVWDDLSDPEDIDLVSHASAPSYQSEGGGRVYQQAKARRIDTDQLPQSPLRTPKSLTTVAAELLNSQHQHTHTLSHTQQVVQDDKTLVSLGERPPMQRPFVTPISLATKITVRLKQRLPHISQLPTLLQTSLNLWSPYPTTTPAITTTTDTGDQTIANTTTTSPSPPVAVNSNWFSSVDAILLQNPVLGALAKPFVAAEHLYNTCLEVFTSHIETEIGSAEVVGATVEVATPIRNYDPQMYLESLVSTSRGVDRNSNDATRPRHAHLLMETSLSQKTFIDRVKDRLGATWDPRLQPMITMFYQTGVAAVNVLHTQPPN